MGVGVGVGLGLGWGAGIIYNTNIKCFSSQSPFTTPNLKGNRSMLSPQKNTENDKG